MKIHPNGGGHIEDGAYVAKDVYFSARCRAAANVRIYGGCFHGGWFHGGDFHGGVFHGGVFRGGVVTQSPLFLRLPRDPISEGRDRAGSVLLCVGDDVHPVEKWLDDGQTILRRRGYEPSLINDYIQWLRLAVSYIRHRDA